jgi:hypothetical protein
MNANLDMNHYTLANVAAGVNSTDAVNLGQVNSLIGTSGSLSASDYNKLFGHDLGALSSGVISDYSTTSTFTAADSGSGLYKINNQINCVGSTNVGSVRSLYSGSNLQTTAGTCGLLSGAHFFTWMMGQGNATVNKVVEAHMVMGQDSNGVSIASPGTVTSGAYFFNTAGITLGANVLLDTVYGYNAGQLTDASKVAHAYKFNAEHDQATTETVGFRSQVRTATGSWSFLSNTNNGTAAAPAGFSGSVAIGAPSNGATPDVPIWTLSVTSLNSDYAQGLTNANATNPFGLRIRYTNANPNDSGHNFISCDAGGTTYFQVASSGNLSIAGSQVLGPRRQGWAAATGTSQRTTFATSTVTLAQLAAVVKALLDDLIAHGIIGA